MVNKCTANVQQRYRTLFQCTLGPEEQCLETYSGYGKTLKIGIPRLTTVVALNIEQFDFSMQ